MKLFVKPQKQEAPTTLPQYSRIGSKRFRQPAFSKRCIGVTPEKETNNRHINMSSTRHADRTAA